MFHIRWFFFSGKILVIYLVATSLFFVGVAKWSHPQTPQGTQAKSEYMALAHSLLVTIHCATGGDPESFRTELQSSSGLWIASWFLHGLAWLYIPAIVALVVARQVSRIEHERNDRAYVSRVQQFADSIGLKGAHREQFIKIAQENPVDVSRFIMARGDLDEG